MYRQFCKEGKEMFLFGAGNTVSSLRLSLKRADHGKLLRCQVTHPALTTVMDIKTFLDIQCKCIRYAAYSVDEM